LELGKLIANLGIADKVLFPERYQYYKGMPPEYLALVYNSADVLLANSMSEGFGIPIIEAQACGTPVITTNFSAMPELVRWGYKIDPLDMLWTPMNAWQAWPDHTGITEALNELYGQWEANGGQWSIAKRLQTQTAIHQEYSWDSIVRDNWQPLITRLANEAPPLPNAQQPQTEVKQVATERKIKGRVQPVQPGEITVNGLQPEAVV
jgi:glycosyltransferase involved in cell wall biosynthesis